MALKQDAANRLEKVINEVNKDIKEADDEVKEIEDKKYREELDGHASRIDAELVKHINQKLDNSKPHNLILLLEIFVALLRDKKKATQVDVKLYLENIDKLQFKLRTMDPHKLTLETV